MIIISKNALNNFGKKHADAAEALNEWYRIVRAANWKDFNDLKRDFPATDYIGKNRFVFNIKGNNYRLIALIFLVFAPFT